jgi:hypothetical protein
LDLVQRSLEGGHRACALARERKLRSNTRDELLNNERLDDVVIRPACAPSTRASTPARAESKTTGVDFVSSRARSSRSSPKPSRLGIITSLNTRSGFVVIAISSAARPSDTVSTCQPCARNRRATYSRMSALSSARSTRAAAGALSTPSSRVGADGAISDVAPGDQLDASSIKGCNAKT